MKPQIPRFAVRIKMRFFGIRIIVSAGTAIVLSLFSAFGQETRKDAVRHELSGYAAYENGQIVKGKYGKISGTQDLDHQWIGRTYVNFVDRIVMSDRFKIVAGIEARVWYNSSPVWKNEDVLNAPPAQNYEIYLTNAEGIYSVGNPANPILDIKIGLFPVKYNPCARNLGDYLFRSGTYPAFLQTAFDLPFERVTGLNLRSSPLKGLRLDVLATTMRKVIPFYDFTISGLIGYSPLPLLDIGAGISLANALSVESKVTTPKKGNWFLQSPASDTGYYTFKGTKVMGRLSIDPKTLIPFKRIFGDEDLKLYAEAAVIGLEKYPRSDLVDSFNTGNSWGYDKLTEKMPVMFGINIPTFKLLDVVAFEAEWYGCGYPDSYENVVRLQLPIPDQPQPGYSMDDYTKDNWKWSLYAKRRITRGFSLIAQCARDHMRLESFNKKDQDFEAALVRPDHWYWMAKARYDF